MSTIDTTTTTIAMPRDDFVIEDAQLLVTPSRGVRRGRPCPERPPTRVAL